MNEHLLGGLAMGVLACVLGVGMGVAAAQRRHRRGDVRAATYNAMGGPVYTVFQFGCATLAVIAGILILFWAFVGR
ncbi:MAG: hypothetical protein J2P40_15540 [Candidatus Dormibacteraeota bacterium]|nr:hypothetical protein [Candidatus Dormibacteraeota bacterium]MBO0762685.1 hypothetical protein [Candidatus Dormibacteraeota bacterium]